MHPSARFIGMADSPQIAEPRVKVNAVMDPREAVAVDVALLETIPALPTPIRKWLTSNGLKGPCGFLQTHDER